LAYNHSRFLEGFTRLKDIFSFAVSSPYAHPLVFDLERRNHKARTRDRKRTTQRRFLEWLGDSNLSSKHISGPEKNLRRLFDAAEQGGAILLFDEADGWA
jgi:hypothetical protein